MIKVILTITERVRAMIILNAFQGKLEHLSVVLDDIKKVSISDEEWLKAEAVGFKTVDGKKVQCSRTDESVESVSWKDIAGAEKEIELNKVTVDYLKKMIDAQDSKEGFTFDEIGLVTLRKKL